MILIVDFLNLAFRSYFAIRSLSNSKGDPTNAIFGFIKSVNKWITDLKPSHLAVVLDGESPARRLELLPQYKAQRPPAPEDLPPQLEKLTQIFPLLGWPTAHHPQEEADDLAASIAVMAREKGLEVRIVSNDKDFFQIVGPKIKVMRSTPKETVLADENWILQRWGIQVAQVVDFFSLMGDSVDNIPGVTGVGEKTASSLIQKYGSVEGIYSSLEKIEKPKLKESLTQHRQDVYRNQKLIQLDTASWKASIDEFRLKEPQYESLLSVLSELEFKSLYTAYKNESLRVSDKRQGLLF